MSLPLLRRPSIACHRIPRNSARASLERKSPSCCNLALRAAPRDGARCKSRKLIAWRDQRGHWQFPLWQFDLEKKTLLPGITECLRELPDDEWSRMLFFLSVDEVLSKKERPIDVLRRGERTEAVIKSAERYGRHGE